MNETIIGAIIALAGVVLTLISSHISDLIKSNKDCKERKLQRELDLKKNVYFPLICAFAEGASQAMKICQS